MQRIFHCSKIYRVDYYGWAFLRLFIIPREVITIEIYCSMRLFYGIKVKTFRFQKKKDLDVNSRLLLLSWEHFIKIN